MRYFLIRHLWVLFLALLLGAPSVRSEEYPIGWENYILLDQLSNVAVRKGETLSAEASQIVPVYHIDVPAKKLSTVQSKYLDGATKKRVLIEKDGKTFVRVFFAEVEGVPFEAIKSLGFPVANSHWGTKMQSHMTYLVWEKDAPQAEPFFVKMSRLDPTATHNGFGNAQQAIKNNDFVESVLRQTGNSFASVFPERFGSGLRPLGVDFSNSLREARPLTSPPGAELAPVHGVLGSKSELETLAKARGLKSGGEWIEQEYLPKLGRFLADLHFRQGIYLEAHSQNILMQLNRRTGKIEGMVGRDLNDVLLDPFITAVRGNPLHFEYYGESPASLMNYRFVDAVLGKYAGPHMGIYPAQSVTDIALDPEIRRRYSAIFLDAYHRSSVKAVGENLSLSEVASQSLQALRSGAVPPTHGYTAEYPEPEGTFMLVAQEVYDRATEARVQRLQKEGLPADHARMQWTLERQFWVRFRTDKAAFLRPDALERLQSRKGRLLFEATEAGILAVDRATLEPLGLAYDLSTKDKANIQKANIPLPKWIEGLAALALRLYSHCATAFSLL